MIVGRVLRVKLAWRAGAKNFHRIILNAIIHFLSA